MSTMLVRHAVQSTAIGNGSVAVLEAPRRFAVHDWNVPDPGEEQVRIRVEGCGVCPSSLALWQGWESVRYPLSPGAPGREGWGRVDAIGRGVHGIAVGDRVVTLSQTAFADHDVVDVSLVVALPDSVHGPFPGEALGCALNVLRRSRIVEGQLVAIVGIGFIGAALTMLASRVGARVIAISRRPFALDLAERMGASFMIRDDGHTDIARQVRAITGDGGCERVIEAMGTQQSLDLATEIAGVRARLVIAGFHQDGARQVDMQLWNRRGLDVINAHEHSSRACLRGVRDAINAVAAGVLDPAPLLTHAFPLSEIDAAFVAMERRPSGFIKAWVRAE